MSIPPLVCSTPPPPDQCEEEKDPEDFDISYNLSQDDDDDDYNFGNFSSYNNIQSNSDIKNEHVLEQNTEILTSCEVKKPIKIETIEHYPKNEQHSGPNITNTDKLKCEEDTNIEDLELEISEEESIDTSIKIENEAINGLSVESSISEINDANEVTEDLRTLSPSPTTEDNSVESLSIEDKNQISGEDVVEVPDFYQDASTDFCTNSNSVVADKDICYETEEPGNTIETQTEHKEETNHIDDDFGDFDDFQFASTANKPLPIINTCENPWESNETENDGFGNFTANFEAVAEINIKFEPVAEALEFEEVQSNDEFQNAAVDDEDDFGDFDDFKSSVVDNDSKCVSEDASSSQQGLGINFYLSDNESQVMESITNVLGSIFKEEVTEPNIEFEGTLETMLSETWRHLRETDIRQPYIVNWNNSLGQKTLLRALCIDSRNILFGPKWSYNMPKYAVNLSNAPLQPQKPLTPSSSTQNDTVSSEKTTAKLGGWVDPFTSDGQESCNTESESVVEVTSSDLDVFEAAISTKSDKIYSSTLNVQPLRQINLPDTHIFTPTDSETPRSKTIHYDCGPPTLLPQPVPESTKVVESFPPQNTETSNENNDDDDWEFQDFKGSSGGTASAPQLKEQLSETKSESISQPNVKYQTQVLQPIRMEPLMPSLNWPDPGEVKETFENFSDFVSKTPWNNESQISSPQDSKITLETDTLENISDRLTAIEIKESSQPIKSESFDDEFDTFKSALPPKNSIADFNFDSFNSSTFNNIPKQGTSQSPSTIKDFDYTFPKFNSNKSDTISVDNTTRPSEALPQSLGFDPTPELTNKNSLPLRNPMSSNLLQPLHVNSNAQKNHKTAQILEPMSLESYSQINWPNPGIDLQDLSRFNPVETLHSLKTELSAGSSSKGASPVHVQKNAVTNQAPDDDIWGEFVSSKPKQPLPKKAPVFADDDEWTDFVSSPSVKSQNGLNTISLNVHTNSNIQKSSNLNKLASKNSKAPLDIPTLNYITPKSSGHNAYNERHFQNL